MTTSEDSVAPRDADVVLDVRGVEKWWDEVSGLRPVSLSMRAGEVVVVRGRSGSGKSTLLAVLAGWCSPDRGTFEIIGSASGSAAGSATGAWSTVAVVPQVLALVPELTTRENIAEALLAVPAGAQGAQGARGARGALRDRVQQVLEELSLTEFADRPPADTSMGQQQRTAVARAVVVTPVLLLADEPTSHQDPGHVEQVVGSLVAAAGRGTAVLIASHDEAVVAAAHRVIDLAL